MTISKSFHLTTSQLTMLVLILPFIALSSSLPLRDTRAQQATEVEESLLNGFTVTYFYSHFRNVEESPISTDDANVTRVLEAVCDLLAYTELVESLNSTVCEVEAIYSILKENIRDTCEWIKELNSTGLVRLHSSLTSPLSCSPEEPTFLHLYCYRARLNPAVFGTLKATRDYFASHETISINTTGWVHSRVENQDLQRKIIEVID